MSISLVRVVVREEILRREPHILGMYENPDLFAKLLSARGSVFRPSGYSLTCTEKERAIVFRAGSSFYSNVKDLMKKLAIAGEVACDMQFVTREKFGYARFLDGLTKATWSLRRSRKSEMLENLSTDLESLEESSFERDPVETDVVEKFRNMCLPWRSRNGYFHRVEFSPMSMSHLKQLMENGTTKLERDYSFYLHSKPTDIRELWDSVSSAMEFEKCAAPTLLEGGCHA